MLTVTLAPWAARFPPGSLQTALFRVRNGYSSSVIVLMKAQVQGATDGGTVGQGNATLLAGHAADIRVPLTMPWTAGAYQLVAEAYVNGTRTPDNPVSYGAVAIAAAAPVLAGGPATASPGPGPAVPPAGDRSITQALFDYMKKEPVLVLGMAAAVVVGWKSLGRA